MPPNARPFNRYAEPVKKHPHEAGGTGLGYTLGQAAKAVGKSKATILRAIKSGKLSADRNPDRTFAIDPAELARAFPPTDPRAGQMQQSDTAGLQRENQLLREVVDDLRRRLDQSEEERRRLTLMLTDQRPWWRRWRR
jgi:hypothetical protein